MNLSILGYCPACGVIVFDSSNYYYDEGSDKYWHKQCLPEDENIGYE